MSWNISSTEDGVALERVGAPAIDPTDPGVESVVVIGGSVDVVVSDPALPFAVRLHSPESAVSWLPFVVGDAAAAAALDAATGAVAAEDTGGGGHLTDVVRRFALGTWMRRWWVPADWAGRSARSPREWLLDAEIGTLAHAGAALFASRGIAQLFLAGATDALPAGLERRLERHGRLVPLSSLVPDSLRDDRIATIIAAAISAGLDVGLPGDDVLEAAETRYWDVLEGETEIPTDAEIAELQDRVLESWQVRMAGAPMTGPIDPAEVHPRSIRATTVSWKIDGPRVDVDIESPASGSMPIAAGELFARVEVGDRTFAIPLDATSDGFAGSRSIDAVLDVAPSKVRVSVYSDRVSAGGRTGRDAADIDAARERIQVFAEARLERVSAVGSSPDAYADPAAPFAVELDYLEG